VALAFACVVIAAAASAAAAASGASLLLSTAVGVINGAWFFFMPLLAEPMMSRLRSSAVIRSVGFAAWWMTFVLGSMVVAQVTFPTSIAWPSTPMMSFAGVVAVAAFAIAYTRSRGGTGDKR
jgi:hypothetical protein